MHVKETRSAVAWDLNEERTLCESGEGSQFMAVVSFPTPPF